MRRLDAQIRESRKKLAIAVKASGTSLTGIFGAGPVIAATVMATWPGSASLRLGSLSMMPRTRIARRRAWFRWPRAGWLLSADLPVPPAAGAARLPFRLTRAG